MKEGLEWGACAIWRGVHWPDGEEGGLGKGGMGGGGTGWGGEACRSLVVTLGENGCAKAVVLTLAEHWSYLGSSNNVLVPRAHLQSFRRSGVCGESPA